jgi:3-oxoacyl-[acyl-carrier-protein] synthase II
MKATPLAITGAGTINALGTGVETFWRRLLAGACGIRAIPFGFEGSPDGLIAASVGDERANPDPASGRSRTDQLAWLAAEEAVGGDSLRSRYDPRRVAVVVGTTTGGVRELERAWIDRSHGSPVPRAAWLLHEKARTADLLGTRLGFLGPRFTLHTACASGASAIALAADLIHAGLADAAVAGGADALARITLGGFRALRALDPEPCRPFDASRRGMSLGEGAGFVVLERPERATSVLAELLGAGQSSDAHHVTAPLESGAGQARAIAGALGAAGLAPGDVDHINAHGTGTRANDAAEARAIRIALGAAAGRCPVTSIKGSIGHTLAAAGAIEAIATIQTLRSGIIPPTAGLATVDSEVALDLVRDRPREGRVRVALSHSFGFGGSNAVLCLRGPAA